ncbi:heat shock protein beta-1 [Austrofundulus limnaeus]|uniref:Heat shock protein beta-1 n=1 Tax=Austrofundulus limnaeus TaxID=52670 RepID=A0A2I4BFU3_AUSLI|nr:PREDICTED: heat shock protein beta-1-like [Austrofundulus limnaeus]
MSETAKMEESCDVGLPPVLEPGDPGLKSRQAACFWPGFLSAPLFVPYVSEPTQQKVRKWRVNMDLTHFRPADISLRVGGGFLEVRGSHEERPDEHGFITRCFSRKYRLPAEVDVTTLTSTLSVDGILTVEAPVPAASAPAAVIIPVKVETEGEEQEAEDKEEDVLDDQEQPSSTASKQTAEESHPSAPAEDKNLESLQKPEQHKAPESPEDPGTSTQLEHREPVTDDGDIQVKEEGAEELTQPEEQDLGSSPPSDVQQELEAADTKQEAAE